LNEVVKSGRGTVRKNGLLERHWGVGAGRILRQSIGFKLNVDDLRSGQRTGV